MSLMSHRVVACCTRRHRHVAPQTQLDLGISCRSSHILACRERDTHRRASLNRQPLWWPITLCLHSGRSRYGCRPVLAACFGEAVCPDCCRVGRQKGTTHWYLSLLRCEGAHRCVLEADDIQPNRVTNNGAGSDAQNGVLVARAHLYSGPPFQRRTRCRQWCVEDQRFAALSGGMSRSTLAWVSGTVIVGSPGAYMNHLLFLLSSICRTLVARSVGRMRPDSIQPQCGEAGV